MQYHDNRRMCTRDLGVYLEIIKRRILVGIVAHRVLRLHLSIRRFLLIYVVKLKKKKMYRSDDSEKKE